MNTIKLSSLAILILLFSCATKTSSTETMVKIETTMGSITVKLYDDTPKHKENFLKQVKKKYYDNLLFHRVVKDFMIQTGDPQSKNAPADKALGAGGPKQTIPAEFIFPEHFHRRGALAAARQGDAINPKKESSGSQFYIVWGKTYLDEELNSVEEQRVIRVQREIYQQMLQERAQELNNYRQDGNEISILLLQDELQKKSMEEAEKRTPFKFTDEQREVYKTVGGTPFLDGEYTIFGEVVEGLDVVEKIQAVATDPNNRPVEDIKIHKATILK